jgi:hypothetical protein
MFSILCDFLMVKVWLRYRSVITSLFVMLNPFQWNDYRKKIGNVRIVYLLIRIYSSLYMVLQPLSLYFNNGTTAEHESSCAYVQQQLYIFM